MSRWGRLGTGGRRRGRSRLIVVGRDGVVNECRDGGLRSPADWRPVPGSLDAIARLHRAGWQVVVMTNQPGLGEGWLDSERLNLIHERLRMELARVGGRLSAIFYCPHAPDAGCGCRKPGAGLAESLARRLRISLVGVPFVGDDAEDLACARAVSARPVLVRTGRGRETEGSESLDGVEVHDDLAGFAARLLEESAA